MRKNKIYKTIIGVVLLITFFMPLSRCTNSIPISESQSEISTDNSAIVKGSVQNHRKVETGNIPYKMIDFNGWFDFVILVSFIWPIPILGYYWLSKKRKYENVIKILEPILCLGSGYFVGLLSLWGETLYGGYIAIASILTYLLISSYETFFILKKHYIKIRAKK